MPLYGCLAHETVVTRLQAMVIPEFVVICPNISLEIMYLLGVWLISIAVGVKVDMLVL